MKLNNSIKATTSAIALFGALAFAATAVQAERISHVESATVANADGTFTYNFTVFNDSTTDESGRISVIFDWEMPYFDDAGITSIQSPGDMFGYGGTWAYEIETIGVENPVTGWGGVANWQDPSDPFYEGPTSAYTTGTKVLHWFVIDTCGEGCFDGEIFPGQSLGGFGFTSPYGPTGAPYQASWRDELPRTGDPDFPVTSGPNSPTVQGNPNEVPEPASLALLGLGLLSAFGMSRRKTK